ncbi:DUF7210 family protein [Actinobacillus capsulatus]|uniref:DUF7210 family protein n=1 Tax=Actinobacillus capsulatus TaxID=717 RepID=UPI00037A43AA|nr:hypothetical protein [Actinobacillus capsulatus]
MAQVKIILTAAHTHGGKQYQAGDTLELNQSTAQFIINMGVGKPADAARKSQKTQQEEKANA